MVKTQHKYRSSGNTDTLVSANTHNKAFITIALR